MLSTNQAKMILSELSEAIENIEQWGEYVSPRMKEKHGYKTKLETHKEQLERYQSTNAGQE